MDQTTQPQVVTPQAPEASSQDLNYAGFWRRYLAYFVDGLALGAVSLGVNYPIMTQLAKNGSQGITNVFASIFSLLIGAGYYIFFWVKHNGQTLGNRLMAIRVVKEDGSPVDVTTAVSRYIGYLISGVVFFLGFLWVAFDKRKQGWHDKIARTLVIKTEGKPKTGLIIAVLLLFFLGISLVGALMGVGIYQVFKQAKENPQEFKEMEKTISKLVPEFTQDDADKLADEVYGAVYSYRSQKGLTTFQPDTVLCGYAQRRLEQMAQLGRLDDHKGFYEDVANQQIAQAYFKDYLTVGEALYGDLTNLTDAKTILDFWSEGGEKTVISSVDYDYACVRANTKFLAIIAGKHR